MKRVLTKYSRIFEPYEIKLKFFNSSLEFHIIFVTFSYVRAYLVFFLPNNNLKVFLFSREVFFYADKKHGSVSLVIESRADSDGKKRRQ